MKALKTILSFIMCTILIGILMHLSVAIVDETKDIFKLLNAKNNIKAGVIYDKEIVNGHYISNNGVGINSKGEFTLFGGFNKTYVPTEYRIYINGEYEYKNKKYETETYFTVSENVYNAYSIGDFFDSTKLSEIK